MGHKGLAAGQSLDLLYENKRSTLKKIINMYKLKTSALFELTISSPFILTNHPTYVINFYKQYGSLFGLIFQIVDDLIDENVSFKKIGKTPGKDRSQGKSTILNLLGRKKVVEYCDYEINKFIKKNKKYFEDNKILKDLLIYSLNRTK